MTLFQVLLLFVAAIFAFLMMRPLLFGGRRVSVADAQGRIAAGSAVLVDVREPSEWRDGVAEPAHLLPLSDLQGARAQWRPFLADHGARELILYCASGIRSGATAMVLKKEGYRVANLGSFRRWAGAGLPTRKP